MGSDRSQGGGRAAGVEAAGAAAASNALRGGGGGGHRGRARLAGRLSRVGQPRNLLLAGLAAGCLTRCAHGLQLQVMVASRWAQRQRRDIQRGALQSCLASVEGHEVEMLFFMGDMNETDPEAIRRYEEEESQFGDLVRVGGPDTDPQVNRDATYVLDRPCSRTYRLAHGTAWLAQHRPELDYVMYLDDDSFLNVPRLFEHLEAKGTPSLAMGYIMETNLDWTDTHVCELCQPCGPCLEEKPLAAFCSQFPDISFGGCLFAVQNCRIFAEDQDDRECVLKTVSEVRRLTDYFGSKAAPRWMLGMGWVFGSRIARYIGRSARSLKVRGAADVMLGFWLAPLEGVNFVSMNFGEFHDHPADKSTFASACTGKTVLVHRMTPERWEAGFDPGRCEMSCSAEGLE